MFLCGSIDLRTFHFTFAMGGEIKFKWASAFLHCLAAPSEPNQSLVIHRQCMAIDFKNQRPFILVDPPGREPGFTELKD